MYPRLALAAALLVAGCGSSPGPGDRQCMNTGGPSDLVRAAARLRVDVYAGVVGCDGTHAAAGAGAPSQSASFANGQAITLGTIPPGNHTVVLTAFDAADTELGGACTDANFDAGAQVCLDLTLLPAPDAGVPDGGDDMQCEGPLCPCLNNASCLDPTRPVCASNGQCVPCAPSDDRCPLTQYCSAANQCVDGCKNSVDCTTQPASGDGGTPDDGGTMASARPLCEPTRHVCVQCLDATDCAVGRLCSPSNVCVDGCDLSKGKTCAAGFTCCSNLCIDTKTDPLNCGMCARACSSTNVNLLSCLNGTCNSTCKSGFGNCSTPSAPGVDDGCEADINNSASDCGGCGRGCSNSNVSGAPTCTGGLCASACLPGSGNCARPAFPTVDDGCEVDLTTDRLNCGGCGRACSGAFVSGMPVCAGSLCTSACTAGHGNCGTPAFPTADDGCESTTTTDKNNCGGCGRAC